MDFSYKHYPRQVIIMVVRWYLAYPLSYRHVEELAKERGIALDHPTFQRLVKEYSSQIFAKVRYYNKSRFTDSWRLDETYLEVKGEWVYLYRMVDSDGETIDFCSSRTSDATAAKRCVSGSLRVAGF